MLAGMLLAWAAEPQATLVVTFVGAPQGKPRAVAVDRAGEGQPSPFLPWQLVEGSEVTFALPPGSFRVRCAAEGAVGGASQAVRLSPGQRQAVVCRVREAVRVRGRVLEAGSGAPVKEAWVGSPMALPGRCQEKGPERIPCELAARTASARSQEDGSFALSLLPGVPQTLVAWAEGLGPGWVQAQPAAQEPITITLPPAGVLEVGLQGEAAGLTESCLWLEPAFVQLPKEEKEALRWLWRQTPDETGWARWSAVPPGLWRLGWAPQSCAQGENPDQAVSRLIHVTVGHNPPVLLETRIRSVDLSLVLSSHPQLAGAEAYLWWTCQQGNGVKLLGPLDPQRPLTAQLALPVGRCLWSVDLFGTGLDVGFPLEPLEVRARGANRVERKVELGEIAGRVLTSDGHPQAALVTYEDLRHPQVSGSCRADAQGWFRCLALPAGRYRLEASVPGEGWYAVQELTWPAAQLQLTLSRGRELQGRVVDGDGAPMAGAWVRFARLQLAEHGFPPRQPGVRSDKDGRFALAGLPEEEGVLTAQAGGGLWGAVRFCQPGGVEGSLELQLRPLGAVWLAPLPEGCLRLAAETSEGMLPPVALAALSGVLTASPVAPSRLRLPPGTYRLLCYDAEGELVAQTARFALRGGEVIEQPPWR